MKNENTNLSELQIRLEKRLDTLEAFIKRRFDEISTEINATSQQVDMAEEEIARRFAMIYETLAAIAHNGEGLSSANSGAELGQVVDITEKAANAILDAAGRINRHVNSADAWDQQEKREQMLQAMKQDVEDIFVACSFQDITGQRINKTLDNIRAIEDRLIHALDKLGIHIDTSNETLKQSIEKASTQEEVDRLFKDDQQRAS